MHFFFSFRSGDKPPFFWCWYARVWMCGKIKLNAGRADVGRMGATRGGEVKRERERERESARASAWKKKNSDDHAG